MKLKKTKPEEIADKDRRAALGWIGGAGLAALATGCVDLAPSSLDNEEQSSTTQALTTGTHFDEASTEGYQYYSGQNFDEVAAAQFNEAKFTAWAANAHGRDLIFDESKTYPFPPGVLAMPPHSALLGLSGATLRCVPVTPITGSSPDWFVKPTSGPLVVQTIVLDGNDNVDYVLKSTRVIINDVIHAGQKVRITDVQLMNAVVANVFGDNAQFRIRDCKVNAAPIGVLLEGCSESSIDGLFTSRQSDCGLRIRGSLNNAVNSANPITNGGRASLARIVMDSPGNYGIDLEGVAQLNAMGVTVERGDIGIRIRDNSTNIRIYGLRSSRVLVEFNNCFNAYVWGGGAISYPVANSPAGLSEVRYLGGARSCRAFIASETRSAVSDLPQYWGPTRWHGFVRPDGRVLSPDGTPPTDGAWEKGDVVWNMLDGPGQPAGWKINAFSAQGQWIPFAVEAPEPVEGCGVNGCGVQSAADLDVLIINYSMHTLRDGFYGKRITVVCGGGATARIGDNGGGNFHLDGNSTANQNGDWPLGWWLMQPGDTISLLCLEDSSGTLYWRETGRSMA